MAATQIDKTAIREYLLQELPSIFEENLEIQKVIVKISKKQFADRDITEDRFERLFEELKTDRKEQNKRWEEQNKRWEEQTQKWEEKFEAIMQEIKLLHRKHDSSIGALGARWGIAAETSFRDALTDILEEQLNVEVYSYADDVQLK